MSRAASLACFLMGVIILAFFTSAVDVAHATSRQWTLMVYVSYDNNLGQLTGLAQSLLNRLQAVGSASGVDVVVLLDMYGQNTHYYHIENGGHTERTDYPDYGTNVDTTDYTKLQTFISWTVAQYPAVHYLLDLHDHGDGFAYITTDNHGAYLRTTSMSMQSLQRALVGANQKIDVLFFHACLMGMMEVANVLNWATLVYGPPRINAVDYMVASENTMPYVGGSSPDIDFPYGEILTALEANPSMNGKTLSQTIVSQASSFFGPSSSVTLSAVEFTGTPNHDFGNLEYDAMNLGNALEGGVETSGYRDQVKTAMKNTDSFELDEWHYVDLYQFASNVKNYVTDSNTQTLADKVMTDITDSSGPVVANYAGSQVSFAHGLSVYIPKSIQIRFNPTGTLIYEMKDYNSDYDTLDFSAKTYWNGFIRAYYGYFDYRVNLSPAFQSVPIGGSTSFTVSVPLITGASSSVQLSVRAVDSDSHASFLFDGSATKTGTPPFTSALTVSIDSGGTAGDYLFYVYAISGKITRQVLAYIAVGGGGTTQAADSPPSFSVSETNAISGSESWAKLPGATLSGPSTSVDGDIEGFAVRGTDNGVYWAYMQRSTLDFYTWVKLTGATSSSPSIILTGNTMYVAVRGMDNGIYWSTVNVGTGTQTSWKRLTGATGAGPSIALSGSTMYVAVRGMDNGIYWSTVNVGTGTQTSWNRIIGATNDTPSIALSSTTMYIAVRGIDNRIYVNSVDLTTGASPGWGSMDGSATGGPILITSSNLRACCALGGLSLMVVGSDGGIYFHTLIPWQDVA
jgi:hypothetical protein